MRDPRATQILTSRFRVQAWFALRGMEWPLISFFDEDLVQTTVELDPKVFNRETALLLEFNSAVEKLEEPWERDQAKLRNIASRLRMTFLGAPEMMAARLVDTSAKAGERVRAKICHPRTVGGRAPSIRYKSTGWGLFHSSLLTKSCRPELDRAIRWYLAGLDATDPFAEAMCLWAAIESLSPIVKRPPMCRKCGCQLPACTKCGEATAQVAVLAGIREYLMTKLGTSKKDINDLYEWRSKLVHGSEDPSDASFPDAAEHVAIIRPMAERLIAAELDGPKAMKFFEDHPDHVDCAFDAIVNCDWHEGVYDLPSPLFSDVRLRLVYPEDLKAASEIEPIGHEPSEPSVDA